MQRPRCLRLITSVVIAVFCSCWPVVPGEKCILLLVPASCTWQVYWGNDYAAGRPSSWFEYCPFLFHCPPSWYLSDSATNSVLVSLSRPLCSHLGSEAPPASPPFAVGFLALSAAPPSSAHALPLSPCHPRAKLLLTQAGVILRGPKPLWAFLFFSKMVLFPYFKIFSINNVNDTFSYGVVLSIAFQSSLNLLPQSWALAPDPVSMEALARGPRRPEAGSTESF